MSPINRRFDTVRANEQSMGAAFASFDYRHIGQHFGATLRLMIYGAKADQVILLWVVKFPTASDYQAERIAERIHTLEDCITLFCVAIGEAVFHQLSQVGVRAERIPDQATILDLLQKIQLSWYKKARHYGA